MTIESGESVGYATDMEVRLARLESAVEHIQRDVSELKADVRSIRCEITKIRTTDFRLFFGALISSVIGLVGVMAKGFGWL